MEPENGPNGRGDSYWKSSFSVNLSIGESTIAFKASPKMRFLVVVGSFLFVDLVPSQVQYITGTPPKTNMQAEIGLLEKEISFGNYQSPYYFPESMSQDLAHDQCGVFDYGGRLGLPAIRIGLLECSVQLRQGIRIYIYI